VEVAMIMIRWAMIVAGSTSYSLSYLQLVVVTTLFVDCID
jgi:hypothetical protein